MDFNVGMNNVPVGSGPFSAGVPPGSIAAFITDAQSSINQYPDLASAIEQLSLYSAFSSSSIGAPVDPSLTSSEVLDLQSCFHQLADAAGSLSLGSAITADITRVQTACAMALQRQNYSCSQLAPALQTLTTDLGNPTTNPFNLSVSQISAQAKVNYLESWMSSGFGQAQQAIHSCVNNGMSATSPTYQGDVMTIINSWSALLTILTTLGLDIAPITHSLGNAPNELRSLVNQQEGWNQGVQTTSNLDYNLGQIITYAENPGNWGSS